MNFDIYAANWDTDKRTRRAKIIADKISEAILNKEECDALEFGCGTGLISFNLCDKFKSISLIDTSKGMIDALNQKIKDSHNTHMTAYQIDIIKEGIPHQKYGAVYTSMALHHIIDIEPVLEKLYDSLADKGYICIVDLVEDDGSFHKLEEGFRGHHGFDTNKLEEVLKNIGYRNISAEVFYRDEKLIEDKMIEYSLFIMTAQK